MESGRTVKRISNDTMEKYVLLHSAFDSGSLIFESAHNVNHLLEVDVGVRKLPEIMDSNYFVGSFMKEGVCAALATSLCYPLDYFKTRIQAGVPLTGYCYIIHVPASHQLTLCHRNGAFSFFRGLLPAFLGEYVVLPHLFSFFFAYASMNW